MARKNNDYWLLSICQWGESTKESVSPVAQVYLFSLYNQLLLAQDLLGFMAIS